MADSPHGVNHADSFDSHDGGPKQPEKKKSRRPANTAFRQQRLKAWQPILTPKTVLPLFFIIGIIFAPIGGLLIYASSQVQELRLDYTRCSKDASLYDSGGNFTDMPSSKYSTAFKTSKQFNKPRWAIERDVNVTLYSGASVIANRCHIQFTLPENMGPPVLFYYHLTNFYQNHRRYVDSFDFDQLRGEARPWSSIKDSKCDPMKGKDDKPYYPCGLIANSMFNDTFTSPLSLNRPGAESNETEIYHMENNTNIAWGSDKDLYGNGTKYKDFSQILPPPNWINAYPDGYTNEMPPPNLKEWEAFQVWMRTAGLPTFSKLYQRNDTTPMWRGTYEVVINDHFNVKKFKGKKQIVLSTRTVMGGRNPFLGIAYIVVGGVCVLLGAIFAITHLIHPRKLGDHTYLSWNNAPGGKTGGPSSAVASGRELRPGEA